MARNIRTALTRAAPLRGGALLLLLALVFSAPWWVVFLVGGFFIFTFAYPIEVFVVFLAYDLLFGTPFQLLPLFLPYFFIGGFLLWIFVLLLRRLSRHSNRL